MVQRWGSPRVQHDFTDIIYAVCVVTNLANEGPKGSASPNLTQAQGPSIARLRKVEHGIRKSGILVSADPITHELFTFFRKADLQRDGKSIFSRLVAVLRGNMCTISDRKAAKAADMLHPDNSRLHRLFISALTPSIRSVVVSLKGLVPCGMASFVAPSPRVETPQGWCIESSEEKGFRLLDMNAQLVASGHLVLSLRQRRSVYLVQPKARNEDAEIKSLSQPEDLQSDYELVLAPSGRIARAGHRQTLPLLESQAPPPPNTDSSSVQNHVHFESTRREIWEAMVKGWLANQGIELESLDQEAWLDVELPARTVAQSPVVTGSPTATHSESFTTWRSFRWPVSLCFELREPRPFTTAVPAEEIGIEDPLSFAEDWFLGAETRAKVLEERRISRLVMEELGNQHTDPETIIQNPLFASSPTFHRHAFGDLSMGNNIYPTPPDGPVSQVTPGMSSMDGVVATPADQNQQLTEASHKHDDEKMQDVMDAEEGDLAIGTGQYDEDLFGDIPVETFGPSGIADEPNWDFFDEPDLEMVASELEPADPGDVENSQSLKIGGSEAHDSSPNIHDISIPSPMLEDQGQAEQDMNEMEGISPVTHQKPHLDSPKSEADHLRNENHKVDSLESTNFDQWQRPLTASEIKHVVTDTVLISRHVPEDPAKKNARSDHELHIESIVDIVHPRRGAQLSNDKYSANGRFWFGNGNANVKETPKLNSGVEIPKIGLRPFDSSSEMPRQKFDGLSDEMALDTVRSESVSSAEQSDFDSSDLFSNANEPTSPCEDATREWTKYAAASPEHPKTDGDPLDEHEVRNEFDQLLEHLRIDDFKATPPVYEWQDPESVIATTKSANDIMIAQILVDQLTQTSLKHTMFSMPEAENVPLLDHDISKGLCEVYGTAEHVNLHQLACVSCAENEEGERISKLGDTNISLYREGKPLTALSTILPFWDALGLQPAGGRKNITALCIHPQGSNVNGGCRVFLERLGDTYENCNLGDHTIGEVEGTTDDGLVSWSPTDASLPDLSQTCERVGTALSQLPNTDDNIMIYMILPSESEPQLLLICEGFMALWSTYEKTCGKKQPNELALQLIPMSFVALPDTLAIPSQNEYVKLAIEVYNRCPPANVGDKIACCGSAILLAESVSKQLDFELSSAVQSPFEKNGRPLHLAYSQSKNNRWITAAWTDTLGNTALTMSYCLRQRGSRISRPTSEVIKELWGISYDLMKKSCTKWWLIVAKDGRATPTEINDWAVLANQEFATERSSQHTLVLISVDCEPSLSLRLPPNMVKQAQGGVTQQQAGLYGTPVSTPQASTTSPDQTTMATPTPGGTALNAPTPPDHSFDPNAEIDLSLSDPVDATWSVALSHGINQAESILEARPALASGYLLKCRGVTDGDNVAGLEVNIMHAAVTSPSELQDLLKQVLSQYKDLVTLARTRGMIDPVNCVLPWHIATAIKGQQVLSLVM
jgi:mediator of RNA polymerase II transcription subunit 13, fungi type